MLFEDVQALNSDIKYSETNFDKPHLPFLCVKPSQPTLCLCYGMFPASCVETSSSAVLNLPFQNNHHRMGP